MKTLRKRFPVPVSIVLTILFPLIGGLAALPLLLFEELITDNLYLAQLIAEVATFVIFLLITLLLGMQFIFRPSHKPLREHILPCLAILVVYTFALLESVILCMDQPLQPPIKILWYVLCMLAVGITEELVFRGLITRMLFAKYSRSSVGVWISVLLSSLLFGLMHLSNAAGGVIDLGSILVQVVGAAALGICLSAIYLRTGSLWTVALLHGYMDFCGLISSGVFAADSMGDLLSGYSGDTLIAGVVYALLGIFLLRPSKMKRLTDPEAQPSTGQIIGLMALVMLTSGVLSAVAVFTA